MICEVRASSWLIAHVAKDLGIHKEALRGWVRRGEADRGERDGRLTSAEQDALRQLHKEAAELRQANEILKAASVLLPRRRRSTVPDAAEQAMDRLCDRGLGVGPRLPGP
ncbi:transposase [Streptomyces shenzhenensis]|uniref:transposase n=1 Tax=Streptomyces shenzhenensis TaxID=943815 RepID=UPI0033D9F546